MKIGFHNFYRLHNGERMFSDNAVPDEGERIFYPLAHLRHALRAVGHDAAALDTAPLESFDAIVFLDYPTKFNALFREAVKSRKTLFLVLFESPSVRPDNFNKANHVPFQKVFTWSPRLEGSKYVRICMPHQFPEPLPTLAPSKAYKLCCMIASQKYSWDKKHELYSERVRAIRWFEQFAPEEFDLYGTRWGEYYFKGLLSIANPVLARLHKKSDALRCYNFPAWRGTVESKRRTLSRYKFCICYENAQYDGWITEKIFDAMFAGCVPIYLGEPHIHKSIPAGAFIDKRMFGTYDSLFRYITEMSDAEYESYRVAAHKFISSDAIKPFSAEAFTNTLMRELIQ